MLRVLTQESHIYDIEKIVFNDTEVLLTNGKPITASDWLNQDLASQFDNLDHKDINFDIQEDTINVVYQGNATGGAKSCFGQEVVLKSTILKCLEAMTSTLLIGRLKAQLPRHSLIQIIKQPLVET